MSTRWLGSIVPVYKIVILALCFNSFQFQPVSGDEGNMPWNTFWASPADSNVPYPKLRSLHVSGVNSDDFILFGGNHGDESKVGTATITLLYTL